MTTYPVLATVATEYMNSFGHYAEYDYVLFASEEEMIEWALAESGVIIHLAEISDKSYAKIAESAEGQ